MSIQMKYFVLKPQGNNAYARASRSAMRIFANVIRTEDPLLADELQEWADSETTTKEKQ